MKKKAIIILITVFTLALLFYFLMNRANTPHKYSGDSPSIYVLSTVSKVACLSNEYDTLTTIDLLGASDLTCGYNGKVYATIAGNSRKGGQEIDVLQNGRLKKRINLSYSLPWISRYNPYDKKLYVGHKCKITYQNENCITVIDTVIDEEENNIMYNYGVEDIAFTQDNKMIVSAWEVTEYDRRLDVFDLETNKIIKTIAMNDLKISSMVAGSDGLIYGITQLKNAPILYVINWQKELVETIDLPYSHPYRVYVYSDENKEYIYVTHLDDDNLREGHTISVVDPSFKKVVDVIDTVDRPGSIVFHNNCLLVGDFLNNKVTILKGDSFIKSIDLERPIDMVVVP